MVRETSHPQPALIHPGDIAAAAVLLTRLPVRLSEAAAARGARAAWAYPLVGAGLGALAGAVFAAALALGLPPGPAAALALAAAAALTGALHEDGLADSADGLWGGWTRERRLEIMRDSRIGAYGVLALVFSLLLRWSALAALAAPLPAIAALVAAGGTSRAAMVWVWAALPPARADGLAAGAGQPGPATALLAGVAVLPALVLLPPVAALAALAAAGLAATALARAARARIGGQTGDVLGAVQQTAETATLLALAAIL